MSNVTSPVGVNCTDQSIVDGLCYQIIPSSQLAESLVISCIGGALCLIAFAFLRGHKTWRPIYHKRATQISDLLCRPAPLRLTLGKGLHRLWSFLTPALTLSDAELLATSGLDTLILIRFIQMGIQMFFPLAIIGCGVLLPLYKTGGELQSQMNNNSTLNADSFMTNTLSNISYGSSRLWAPWVLMVAFTVWCLWCLHAHCRSYAALQALHTHASFLIRELDTKVTTPIGEKANGENETQETLIPIAGLTQLVGTVVSREAKYGPGARGWWKAAGKLSLQLISPLAMMRADIELVERCSQRLDDQLQQYQRKRKQQKKEHSLALAAARASGKKFKTLKSFKSFKEKNDPTNPWALLRAEDWGPAVSAEVPEVVCPWWLNIEDTPAAVNPVLQGGGVLLGKTNPQLRARILGLRDSRSAWAPAADFAVLYRAGGPLPTDHWAKFLTLSDKLDEAERKLEEESEQMMNIDESNFTSDDINGTFSNGGFGATTKAGFVGESTSSAELTPGTKKFAIGLEHIKSKVMYTPAEKRIQAGQLLEDQLRKLYPTTFQELVPVYNHIPADKAMQKWDHTAGALARVERNIDIMKKDLGSSIDIGGSIAVSGGISNGGENLEQKLKDAAGLSPSGGGRGGEDIELGTAPRKIAATPTASTTTLSKRSSKRSAKKAAKKAKIAAKQLPLLLAQQKELVAELATNEADLAAARAACLANPLGTAYFALFTNHRDARAAAAGHIGATPLMNMTSEMAPGPDDVNWQGLWAGWRERALRTIFYCIFPMFVIILFPIGPITGALTNLTVAVCGSGTSQNGQWNWLCDSRVLQFLITVILPLTLSTFWDTWVMPMVLFIVCQAQRAHASFSALDKAVVRGFYAFSFLNTFIGAVLGGSFLQQIGAALEDGDIITLVGTSIPSASNFFLNYIGCHALFTNIFRFIWPHDGTVLFVFFRYFGWFLPGCERDEWVIRSTPSYRSGRHYGAFQATYIMVLCYAVVAPLILPITAIYFYTAYITWRYSAVHFYDPCYDGGGRIFELSYTLTLVTLLLANIFTATVIMTKGLFWIGGSLIAVSTLTIVVFWTYCNAHVMQYTGVVPSQVAELSPTAVVPRECYLPPVLRKGAVGWFPEQGKIWEKYGLPKFVF